ncbi:MAG TPA: hydroxymethylglutaryl-CoA reductase, partial [Fluviicola sp.]|nr:hydroxymethylglutaryl-CoA reductase [Fluviicola sp.]
MERVFGILNGFSKMSKDEKLEFIGNLFTNKAEVIKQIKSFQHKDDEVQELLEEFSENTISNFHLPYSIAPNFLINNKMYAIPMVIEESSVVAAASNSAKFWCNFGGFKTEVSEMLKVGQVHFTWNDSVELLQLKFPELKAILIEGTKHITANMEKRGGGIHDIVLKDLSDKEPGLMQLFCTFNTVDSMGANFINSCLEEFAALFKAWYADQDIFSGKGLNVLMCILSNLTPNCKVTCWVETPISNLDNVVPGISGKEFAERFQMAVRIAQIDPYRAATHNKGIYNGIDAVVLATGNDFRAVESCGHAYASMDGSY